MANGLNLLSSAVLDRPKQDPLARLHAQADRLKNAESADRAQIRKMAVEFESLVLGQMLSIMVRDIDMGRFGGGFGEDVWNDHLVSEYGRALAQSGSIGIADSVERELLRAQNLTSPNFDGYTRVGNSTEIRARARQAYASSLSVANKLAHRTINPLPPLAISPVGARAK